MGNATSDDAAIYKLSDDLALVLTTDFFTPIVDRPYDFGAIAAANAISDVYAMAGEPVAAFGLVGFPAGALPVEVLGEILRGAGDKAREAGIAIVGGHTIQSEEPIFGLAVIGKVHPKHYLTNAGARPGDMLVLTKPLGTGVITTAAKQGLDTEHAIDEAVILMSTLNKDAAAILSKSGATALTDVTGFGFLGHLRNMLSASSVSAEVWYDQVPVLSAARTYVRAGIAPGGTHKNRTFSSQWAGYAAELGEADQLLLCDAQTSGGLLAAIPPEGSGNAVKQLREAGLSSACIVGVLGSERRGRTRVVKTCPHVSR